jgi:hypothetical protein
MALKGKEIVYKMLTQNRLFLVWFIGLALVTYYVCVSNTNNKSNKSNKSNAKLNTLKAKENIQQIEGFSGSGPQLELSEGENEIVKKNKEGQCGNLKDVTQKCTSCNGKDGEPLLPVLEPMFNMREISKQSILLEDHLFQKDKRCEDCICKHFLTIEALAEEAVTLDKDNKYTEYLEQLPSRVRDIQKKYLENKNNASSIAQDLRAIRKEIMIKAFSYGLTSKGSDSNK